MAVIILGSGFAPVVGTREFYPIPGGSSTVGDVSISSGDVNNYIMTSTGTGSEIQGESNLRFNGATLTLNGNFVMSSGNITVASMTEAVTTTVLNYNTTSGLISYNSSGGGTSNFLRADGTWVTPSGAGDVSVDGAPTDNSLAIWTDSSSIEGDSNVTWDGSELNVSGDLVVNGGVLSNVGMPNTASSYVVHYNIADGSLSYSGSGVNTEYLSGDGTWSVPVGSIDIVGTPSTSDIVTWFDVDTVEGNSTLNFDSGVLHVESGIETQIITELNSGYGVRFSDKVYIGRDVLPTSPLTVGATSGSVPVVYIDNQSSGYALQIDGSTAATMQQNIVSDAGTNTIVRGLDILHSTSGTVAASFGTGITLSTQYDSGVNQISAAIDTVITDPVYASGDADLSIKLNSTNVLEERFLFTSAGVFQTDTINEYTSSAGVTIEGVVLKDSSLTIPTANYLYLSTAGTTNIYDNAGTMTFTDTATGPVTLATLANAGATIGSTTQIPYTNVAGTDFIYDSNFIYDSSDGLTIGDVTSSGTNIFNTQVCIGTEDSHASFVGVVTSDTDTYTTSIVGFRYGGTVASPTAAPTNAIVYTEAYTVYDGTNPVTGGAHWFQVDGAIATDDFDGQYIWTIKEGAAAAAQVLELNVNGLEYSADHSTDQASNDRWLPDKGYVDSAIGAAGGLSASGVPANDQIGIWTTASALEGTANLTFTGTTLDVNDTLTVNTITEHTTDSGVTIEDVVFEDGEVLVAGLIGTGSRLIYADTSGNLIDGNLSGHITTTNSLVTSITSAAITDQTAISAFAADDTFLVYDTSGTALSEGTVTQLETYMQNNLSFSTAGAQISGTPADNRIAVWTGTTDIEGDANLTWNGSILNVTGIISFTDTNTEIWEDASGNLTFKDAVTGTCTLEELLALPGGTVGQIPFINVDEDGLNYSSSLVWTGAELVTLDPIRTYSGMYFNSGSTSIDVDSGGNITFTDAVSGSTTLATLLSTAAYTFDSGLTESGGTVVLGGALTTTTTIDASNYDLQLRSSNTSSRSNEILVADGNLMLSAYSTADWTNTDTYGRIQVINSYVQMLFGNESGSGDFKSIVLNDSYIRIQDEIDEIGLQYDGDYSTNGISLGDRWIPDYAAVTSQLGGQSLDSAITSPAVGDNGKVVTWNNTNNEYELTTASAGDVAKVGNPADNQIGVWTGDGTIEGDTGLTWSGTVLDTDGSITVDTINEHTAASGVTIEGITIKDSNIEFGSSTTYIHEAGIGNRIDSVVSGNTIMSVSSGNVIFNYTLSAASSSSIDIGSTTSFFSNVYSDKYYIEDTSTSIELNSSDLQFTDVNAGSITLSELAEGRVDFVTDTGTTYTLVLTDAGKIVTLSDSSDITLTVPLNSSVAFPVGTQITVIQIGAGQVTITPTSGVDLRSADGDLKLRKQYSSATLIKHATDEWYVVGDITA